MDEKTTEGLDGHIWPPSLADDPKIRTAVNDAAKVSRLTEVEQAALTQLSRMPLDLDDMLWLTSITDGNGVLTFHENSPKQEGELLDFEVAIIPTNTPSKLLHADEIRLRYGGDKQLPAKQISSTDSETTIVIYRNRHNASPSPEMYQKTMQAIEAIFPDGKSRPAIEIDPAFTPKKPLLSRIADAVQRGKSTAPKPAVIPPRR